MLAQQNASITMSNTKIAYDVNSLVGVARVLLSRWFLMICVCVSIFALLQLRYSLKSMHMSIMKEQKAIRRLSVTLDTLKAKKDKVMSVHAVSKRARSKGYHKPSKQKIVSMQFHA